MGRTIKACGISQQSQNNRRVEVYKLTKMCNESDFRIKQKKDKNNSPKALTIYQTKTSARLLILSEGFTYVVFLKHYVVK